MAIYSKLIEGLNNGDEMFVKVFTVNPKGRVNNRVDLPFANCIPSELPAEPSSYELIDTYTSTTTFTAPETGWYQIEVHGASGKGGNGMGYRYTYKDDDGDTIIGGVYAAGGGGGGGSGYGCSIVKLNKGDTIVIVIGTVGNSTTAQFNSSIEEYSSINVSSGGNGGNGSNNGQTGGTGGAGGVSTGGNITNLTGNTGTTGRTNTGTSSASVTMASGGSPAHADGNTGGKGGNAYARSNSSVTTDGTGEAGNPGFIKIYRGDTNIVA